MFLYPRWAFHAQSERLFLAFSNNSLDRFISFINISFVQFKELAKLMNYGNKITECI